MESGFDHIQRFAILFVQNKPDCAQSSSPSAPKHKPSPLAAAVFSASEGDELAVEDDTQDETASNPDEDDQANYPGAEDASSLVTLRGEVTAEKTKGLPSFNFKYFNRNVRLFLPSLSFIISLPIVSTFGFCTR